MNQLNNQKSVIIVKGQTGIVKGQTGMQKIILIFKPMCK